MGAVLSQIQNGQEVVIEYASRSTKPHQKHYWPPELECLAVRWVLGHFHHYIEGRHFLIHTDHSSLKWLKTKSFENQRLMRWAMDIQQYDFDIIHIPGFRIPHVD
uniref:Reverse transcriptase RNase H-like domain-containing protein n=1 Tax=Arcella intermedia TaxID=1963864 RepID=A0A6B2LRZ6_9EUKA